MDLTYKETQTSGCHEGQEEEEPERVTSVMEQVSSFQYIDQDLDINPVTRASTIFKMITDRMWTKEMQKQFDHKPNFHEMLRYMECFADCESKDGVFELLGYLDPVTESAFTVFAMVLSVLDVGADWWAIILAFLYGGISYTFMSALFIYSLSTAYGVLRIADIGKEAYNIRKTLVLGLTNGGHHASVSSTIEPYKYQAILDFWERKWMKTTFHSNIIQRSSLLTPLTMRAATSKFASAVLDNVSITLKSAWRTISREQTQNEPINLTPFLGDGICMSNQELNDLIALIDRELMPPLPLVWCLHISSLPLNYWLIAQTWDLHSRCHNPEFWVNKESVLRIYVQATFLHFVRFSCAEVTKTELFVETIPQLILKTTSLAWLLVTHGPVRVLAVLSPWQKILMFLSFLALPAQMVLPTLKKMEFYFAVYREGRDFQKDGLDEEGGESGRKGVKLMPAYTIGQKVFCGLGHALVMDSVILTAALSCCTPLGPFPLLVLFLIFTHVFWKPNQIPFYDWYYTWTTALSTLGFERREFKIEATKKKLVTKWVSFLGGSAAVFVTLGLSMSATMELSELLATLWSLFIMQLVLITTFCVGIVLQYVERIWFKYKLGSNNYNIYVRDKD